MIIVVVVTTHITGGVLLSKKIKYKQTKLHGRTFRRADQWTGSSIDIPPRLSNL